MLFVISSLINLSDNKSINNNKNNEKEILEFVIGSYDKIMRIDSCISKKFSFLSRSFVVKMLNSGNILVNNNHVKKDYMPKIGDKIFINIKIIQENNLNFENPKSVNIPIEIIFEDEFLIVVNKPKGMVVHPAPGHYDDTLVNALLYRESRLSNINGNFRPGIVHRLDKDTSGLLLVAKNNFVHENLANQIKNKTAKREYLGIIHGSFKFLSGIINLPIGRDKKNRKKMAVTDLNSRSAVTHYKILKIFNKYSFVKFFLETGRTHQIRVHSSYMGHPLAGDLIYGAKNDPEFLNGQCLHAARIEFEHPVTHKSMEFLSDLPEYFRKFLYFISKN